MKKHRNSRSILLIILPAVLFTAFAPDTFSQQLKDVKESTGYPPATVPNTEMRSFYSQILGREMNIFVKLPVTYLLNKEKKYPAWYYTDANRAFTMMANIVSIFEIPAQSQPEIILVGIGYKLRDMADWADYRTRDLTPVNIPSVDAYWNKMLSQMTGREFNVRSGGSDKFIDFIAKELIPFIESNYRVTPGERCLGGYSYGGLFSLYALFTRPELFTKYFAGSPSISFGNGLLFDLENKFASTHKDLNVKLCLTVGGKEDSVMVADMNRMAAILKSRNYPGLSVESFVFPDEWHQSCMPAALMRGLLVLNK
jgi:predicted alpha/beta superfamily hydrolase